MNQRPVDSDAAGGGASVLHPSVAATVGKWRDECIGCTAPVLTAGRANRKSTSNGGSTCTSGFIPRIRCPVRNAVSVS